MQLSVDELRWLHASDMFDDAPAPRVRTVNRTSQRHRHFHLLDQSTVAPSPRRPTPSLIPAPAPAEWIYRSPKRPPPEPRPRTRSIPKRPVHSVIPRPLCAKDKEKERSIWSMLRADRPRDPKSLAIVIARARPSSRHRASSASSNSTINSSTSAQSASTPATSPPASPKPPSYAPTKSILSRSASASSRPVPQPQRSLAALFTRGPSTASVKSVTFVDEPTVHYPDEFDTESEDHDDLASRLTNGALAWEMGLDIDTMDLDLSLELDVAPSVNLDAPLELDIGQKYVPPKRDEIPGILEEDEDAEQDVAPKPDSLKRFWSLGNTPPKTERKIKRRSAPLPTRPTISGPFALGSSPPISPTTLHPSASRSSTSLRSQARSATSTIRARSRSNSNSTTDTLPASSSAPSTPIRTHSRRPRTAPPTVNPSPTSTTSSLALGAAPPRCGPYAYASSLHTAPSLESFRSAAGRSVRSLGSIKSTASARSAIRALLGKIGIGVGGGEGGGGV